jgi:WD40 repeat protein
VSDGSTVYSRRDHSESVTALLWSDDSNLLISGAADATVKIWNGSNGALLHTISAIRSAVTALAISPDSRYLCVAAVDLSIRVFRLSDGQLEKVMFGHHKPIESLAFHPNGWLIASASRDGIIGLWNAAKGLGQTQIQASDLPIGLVVRDFPSFYEAVANADGGPPLGRELEMAGLLRFMRDRRIRNTVWITADVHYCAAHYYDPSRARFTDFDPFWEFVAGPLNAGTFPPNDLDPTFGPEVKFTGVPPGMKGNRPPSDGLQFFGTMTIDPRTQAMTVKLHDLSGRTLYSVELEAAREAR